MRQHINFVTPLYLERMHIIYDFTEYQRLIRQRRKEAASKNETNGGEAEKAKANDTNPDAAKKAKPEDTDPDPAENETAEPVSVPALSKSDASEDVRYFFEKAKISTGPVGSGSRVFAKYLLTHCEINKYDDRGLQFKQALGRLDAPVGDQKIDVVFTIAGAPLNDVTRILESSGDQRFRLMSVDPAVIPAMNQVFKLRLNKTDFQKKYEGGNLISTIGSWAFLIASRDVSNAVISQTLGELDKAKDEIRREMDLEEEEFELSEFNFYETYKIGQSGSRWRGVRNLLMFLAFVAVVSTIVTSSTSWFISNINKASKYRELTRVYEEALEENWTIKWPESSEDGFPRPVIHEDQKEIVSNLVKGTSELSGLAISVRQAYSDGGLLFHHRSQFLDSVDDIRAVLRKHLARRLNEYYANYGEYEAVELRHFFTAGYLSTEDYDRLERKFGSGRRASEPFRKETIFADEKLTRNRILGGLPSGQTPRIFISYRRDDSKFAVGRIRERLIGAFGKDVVFQDLDIPVGRDFREYIEQEVLRCDVFLAIIGTEWASIMRERRHDTQNDYLRAELETALNPDRDSPVVVPVLLAPAQIPYEEELPLSIRGISYLQAVPVRTDPDFHSSVTKLIGSICETLEIENVSISEDNGEPKS